MVNDGAGQLSLLALQSRMKSDPPGYEEELLLQLRHFEACLSVFRLQTLSKSPLSSTADQNGAKELADMVMFLAHVTPSYPQHLKQFPYELLNLLQSTGESMQPSMRRQFVHALILLRNRQMIELIEILPVLMELQTLGDKALMKLASLHIIQDIRKMNLKHRNEAKNRALQNMLFQLLQDDDEKKSKRALAVLCDLHRRKLWADERTGNAICAACFHKSSKILRATLSFLVGYEQIVDDDEDEFSEDDVQEHSPVVALSREAVYKAHHKGTVSSKRKKQAKLQRLMRSLKKQQRNQAGYSDWTNSPLQYLHDAQGFVEKLFSCLQTSNERFEVKLMMMKVISRTVGLHRLLLLNFYPFLQKYVQPHQREITHVLAAAIQACHAMVPPDVVESLLRQIVTQFVHDRARPEVIAVGLNAVREMCVRMPLIMTRDLLHDLALYKKSREKAVSSAARSIIMVFRQIFPSLLEKRDRGKGADRVVKPKAYGETQVPSNVPGIELLKAAGRESDFDVESGTSDVDLDDDVIDGDLGQESVSEEEQEGEGYWDDDGLKRTSLEESLDKSDESSNEDSVDGEDDDDLEKEKHDEQDKHLSKRQKFEKNVESSCSLRELKRLLSDRCENLKHVEPLLDADEDGILSNEDFNQIKKLQAKKIAQAAFSQHGFMKHGKEETVKIASLDYINERRVNPDSLEVKIRRRREKEERIARVRAGQEEREAYASRTFVKQKKTGGLSNRQKNKRKNMPLAAKRATAARSRIQKRAARRLTKQFRGKKAWKQ